MGHQRCFSGIFILPTWICFLNFPTISQASEFCVGYPGPDTAIQRLDPPLLWHRPYPCGTAPPPTPLVSSAATVALKGIPKVLSPELLFALARMGHGDEIGELVESQADSVASSSGAVCTGSP